MTVYSSLAVGLTGILASGGATFLLGRRTRPSAHHYWALGLGGLFPAWLISFIALLQSAPGAQDTPLPPAGLFSSSIALLGIIATEFLVRWLDEHGRSRSHWSFWSLGALALGPGWIIALRVLR